MKKILVLFLLAMGICSSAMAYSADTLATSTGRGSSFTNVSIPGTIPVDTTPYEVETPMKVSDGETTNPTEKPDVLATDGVVGTPSEGVKNNYFGAGLTVGFKNDLPLFGMGVAFGWMYGKVNVLCNISYDLIEWTQIHNLIDGTQNAKEVFMPYLDKFHFQLSFGFLF